MLGAGQGEFKSKVQTVFLFFTPKEVIYAALGVGAQMKDPTNRRIEGLECFKESYLGKYRMLRYT
jgi:hypothetical protein